MSRYALDGRPKSRFFAPEVREYAVSKARGDELRAGWRATTVRVEISKPMPMTPDEEGAARRERLTFLGWPAAASPEKTSVDPSSVPQGEPNP